MSNKATSEEAARLRKFIEQRYAEGVVRGEDEAQYSISPASITADRGAFVRDLCISEGAKRTLEIGMAWGMSTLFILEALLENGAKPGAHVAIDPYETIEYHGAGRRNVKEVGLEEFVDIREEQSEILLPQLITQKRRFDFAFIDGSHLFDNVFVDMVFVNRLLKPGGVVVFDDTFSDAVHLACRFAETNYGYTAVADHQSGGGADDGRKASDGQKEGWRATMRALRKPVQTERGTFNFIPFFPQVVAQGSAASNAWHHNDLTASTGAQRPQDKAGITSYSFSSSGHVYFADASGHVNELWFDLAQGPSWNHRDLTESAGAPLAVAGTALTSYTVGSSGHLFYIDASNHVRELWFDPVEGPGWHHNDLTTSAGAPPATPGTALTSFAMDSSHHVFFIDKSNHIHELWFDSTKGSNWSHRDLNASTRAPSPAAGTALTSYPHGSSGHVLYIDTTRHVRELWFDLSRDTNWHHLDLTASAAAPRPATGTALTSYTLGSSGHVFYVDVADHVRELWFDLSQGPKWHHNDVITSAGVSHGDRHSTAAKAALTSYALKTSGHLLFIGADNHLHEMWFDADQGLSWHHNDITASTGSPLPLAGTPLTNFSFSGLGHVIYIDDQHDVSELYFVPAS